MSTVIDERVVSMKFDNNNFEKNVESSMKSLKSLNDSLNSLSSVNVKGFENLAKTINSFSLSPISNSLDAISEKFNGWSVAAITAIQNVTNRAVDAGIQLAKSLSLDQVTAGWGKYEQKTSSVQTLVNSTGKSIEEIDEYLEKLMWFSDETSYSFTDMTSALAQMTSSGGDIDKLMPMITGIANATAFAGKGATEFQSTIRNLAQSYQAGFLQLQDMKSLNLMGTSSKQLKETFISVAESMGKIAKGSVTLENFDTTLKDQWADTEVMEVALGKFSELSEAAYEAVAAGKYDTAAQAIEALSKDYDDLAVRAFKSAQEAKTFAEAIDATKDAVSSGWLSSFEIIFGNYEEAKVLWTDLANTLWDIFASGAEGRNELLQEWKDLGGREDILDGIKNAFNGVMNIIENVKEAFSQIFPEAEASSLVALSKNFKDLTASFRDFTESNEVIGTTIGVFKGLFAAINQVKSAYTGLFKNALKPLISAFKESWKEIFPTDFSVTLMKISAYILKIGAAINNSSQKIQAFVKERTNLEKFKDIFKGVLSVIDLLRKGIISAFNIISEVVKPITAQSGGFINIILNVAAAIGRFITSLNEGFAIVTSLDDFKNRVVNTFTVIKDTIAEVFSAFKNKRSIDIDKIISSFSLAGFNESIALKVTGFIESIVKKIQSIKNLFKNFSLSDALSGNKGISVFDKLKENLLNNATIIGKILDFIKSKFKSVFNFISNVIGPVASAIGDFLSEHIGPLFNAVARIGGAIVNVFVSALNMLTAAFDGLAKAFETSPLLTLKTIVSSIGSSVIFKSLSDLINVLSKRIEKNGLGNALIDLVKTIKDGNIVKTIEEIKGAFGKTEKEVNAKVLRNIAVSIAILAGSLVALSLVDVQSLGISVAALSLMLAELVEAMKALKKVSTGETGIDSLSSLTTNLIKFSIAIALLGGSLAKISSSGASPEQMLSAVVALSAVLWELVGVAKVLGGGQTESFSKAAGSLILFAAAVRILAKPLATLAQYSWDQMLVAVLGLSAVIWELVGVVKVIGGADFGNMSGLISLTVAVSILGLTLSKLASLSLQQIVTGLIGITVMLGELLIMAKMLSGEESTKEAASGMLMMAIAVAILGKALSTFGNMSADQLTQGFLGMIAMMGGLLVFLKLLPDTMLSTSVAVLALCVAMNLMASAIAKLGSMDFNNMLVGLAGLAGGMAILVLACKFMEGSIGGAFAMLIVAGSLVVLAKALQMMGEMSLEEIGRSLLVLTGALVALGVAMYLMEAGLPGAAALLVAAGALIALAIALNMLRGVSIEQVGVALLGLAGVITIFAVAAALITPLLIPMLGLAAVLVLLGATVALVGAGMLLMGEAMGLLGMNGPLALDVLMLFCTTLADNIAIVIEGSYALAALDAALIGLGVGLVLCAAGAGLLAFSLVALSLGLLAVSGAAIILVKAFNYILDQLPEMEKKFEEVVILFSGAGGNIVEGIIKGIKGKINKAKNTIKKLGKTILNAFKKVLGIHSPSVEFEECGENSVAGYNKGVEDKKESAWDKIKNFGKGLKENFTEGLGELAGGDLSLSPDISLDTSNITLDGDADTESLFASLMSGNAEEFSASTIDMTELQEQFTASTKESTDAIKEETAATRELKYTRQSILDDFNKNGTNLLTFESEEQKKEFNNILNNEFDEVKFDRFISDYGLSLDEIKEKTGATVSDIAVIFSDLPTLMEYDNLSFGNALVEEFTTYLGDREKIAELGKAAIDKTTGKVDYDKFLKSLGFDSIARMDEIFADLQKSVTDTGNAVTDTTKKAVMSASELEAKAKEVIAGKYGNGADRVKALGDQYAEIQNKVNEMLGSSVRHKVKTTVDSASLASTNNQIEQANQKSAEWRENIIDDYQNKIPTAVKDSIKAQLSWQDQILQNESKIPTQVANAIKGVSETATEASKLRVSNNEVEAKSTSKLSDILSSLNTETEKSTENNEKQASSVNSITDAISNLSSTSSSTTTAAQTVDVEPKFNLSNMDTTEMKTKLSDALNEAAKDISVTARITITANTLTTAAALETFKKKVDNLKTEIPAKLFSITTSFGSFFNKLVTTIKTKTETISVSSKNFGTTIAMGVANGINSNLYRVTDACRNIVEAVQYELGNLDMDAIAESTGLKQVMDFSNMNRTNLSNLGTNGMPSSVANQMAKNNSTTSTAELAKKLDTLNTQNQQLLAAMQNQQPTPVNVDVQLKGDTSKFFSAMQTENTKYTNRTGRSAFA